MRKRTARDIRRHNRFEVLQSTYAAGEHVSRQQIATATGLSTATVANLTGELLDVGVLVEVGREDSGGGRPRARLAVNAERGLLVGVDVSEDFVRLELYDLAMNVLRAVERRMDPRGSTPGDVVEHITLGVDDLLATPDVDPDRVLGIGVSLPGLVEREGGVSVLAVYGHWRDVPMKALLAERLDFPLYVDNPLKASTVAELWFGAGRDVDDLAVVTLRTGVGVGVAIDGTLYRGTTNSAGEWGHIILVMDGRTCRCGARGCVEAYVGAPGILQTLRETDPHHPILTIDDQIAAIEALADAARRHDPTAQRVIEETGRHLGASVATMINMLNPARIVLGDWVADRLGEPLLTATRNAAAHYSLDQPFGAVTLSLSELPDNAVCLGTATFALEGFLNDLTSHTVRFPARPTIRKLTR
ncbi:ROK family protein (plasmid) [Embleya sp. NBC_00888]|uniref:ROK family protein n=1 Tax=Embleya sp. NBC_00888 TaxID=2975960 RepID=UPI002F90F386|nr:ROK family protein [Embleya sp. NBC_00888]